MLEILILVATLFLAKHPTRRRAMALRRVRITPLIALSTLGSTIAIVSGLTAGGSDTYRCVTVKATWSLTGLTSGEGPITVGYAHSNYDVTQIKEALESASLDKGNKLAQEKANRLVRIVGSLSEVNVALNEGKPIKTRLNWLISIGDNVNSFAYNESAAALTTGANVHCVGDMWIKDSA